MWYIYGPFFYDSETVIFRRKDLQVFFDLEDWECQTSGQSFAHLAIWIVFIFCVAEECNIPFMGYKESIFKLNVVMRWFKLSKKMNLFRTLWSYLSYLVHLCVGKTRMTNRNEKPVPLLLLRYDQEQIEFMHYSIFVLKHWLTFHLQAQFSFGCYANVTWDSVNSLLSHWTLSFLNWQLPWYFPQIKHVNYGSVFTCRKYETLRNVV